MRGSRILPVLAYHAFAAGALFLFAGFAARKPGWALEPRALLLVLVAIVAYGLAALASIVLAGRKQGLAAGERLGLAFAAATVVFATAAFPGAEHPAVLALWMPLFGLALLLVGQFFQARLTWRVVAAPALLAVAGLAVLVAAPDWMRTHVLAKAKPTVSQYRIRSSLYDLTVTSFTNYLPKTALPRGGLAVLADRYLLATGDGQLLAFRPSPDRRSLEIRRLAYRIPMNAAEFVAATDNQFRASLFRVTDVIAQEHAGMLRILATHHYWKPAEHCWVMRVSALQGPPEALLSDQPTLHWKTVFETTPCIPLALPGQPPRFDPLESGGRLAWLSGDRLLVTIGDHSMNGWDSVVQAPQDEAYSFGKIIALDLGDGSSEIFSRGHRNPQGLEVSGNGQVWSTEHGPEGGDELNLIAHGGNYGWPFASYGTAYGSYAWPLAAEPDGQRGYIEPFYSWVPAIGVSSLIELTSPLFERWRGDLLACSLRDRSFWRIRVREGRVVMTERFPFGQRIRDVVQGHDGSLVVWSDDLSISFIAPRLADDGVSGASIFRTCAGCHVAPDEGGAATAPSLVGIVNRSVASDPDFPYSPALSRLGGTWTADRLDAFLADVSGFAPGTSMTLTSIADLESRKAVIDYLASPGNRLDRMPDKRVRVEAPQY